MSKLFYNISVYLYYFLIWLASYFNIKAKKFIWGRKGLLNHVKVSLKENRKPIIWFHAASLGEFEQGRPVIEQVRSTYQDYSVVLTFFSPSGYEIRKDYEGVDYVFYLPLDTPSNAKRFIDMIQPEAAVFIKYEFWYNYLSYLNKQGVTTLSISSIFRDKQMAFHPLGFFFKRMLRKVDHFFVQNEHSENLLNTIKVNQVTISGDTRFDRVSAIAENAKSIDLIEKFKAEKPLLVIGSSWPMDIEFLLPSLNNLIDQVKIIVAPHNIFETDISQIEHGFKNTVRYSALQNETDQQADVLIVDNIGMLSSLYQYADFVFVGGGFRGALHNTLEAAVFGVPIIFGKHENNKKFQESRQLLELQAGFEVSRADEFQLIIEGLIKKKDLRIDIGLRAKQFVQDNTGATELIIDYLKEKLKV